MFFPLWQINLSRAQDFTDEYFFERFDPSKPTLNLKYEVNYRLFWINLLRLANAAVYATDGEWLNEATGAWVSVYLLIFHMDTLEDPSETGKSRYAIHNRLATVLLKPNLEPLFFVKRDYMRVDTFFNKTDVNNIELFSVEAGKHDYFKRDFLTGSATTNMPHFAELVSQRKEVFHFMKTITGLYAGNTDFLPETNRFTVSIYTDNAFIPFQVTIQPKLRKIEVLDKDFKAIFFKAQPASEFSGRGRELLAWVAPFRYVTEITEDPGLIWLAGNTFEMGMIPLMAEYGLKIGAVRCVLSEINISNLFSSTAHDIPAAIPDGFSDF